MELIHSGKVRDVYADGNDLLLVASDRVSIYDVILPTPVPGKGRVLTQLSLWWFDRLTDIVPNHVISATDVPAEWAGRAIRCQRLDMVPVECIARGYLSGLGLVSYNETGAVSGVPLPEGLVEASKLPEPVFTPTTKAAAGHDEPMTYDEVVDLVGAQTAAELKRITLAVYQRGADLAAERGIIVADTKLEFGTGQRRRAGAGGRGAHPGLVPVLASGRVPARAPAVLLRQAVPARLVHLDRLEPEGARPRGAGRRDRQRNRALRGAVREDHRGLTARGSGERDGGGEATRPFEIKALAFKYRRPQPVSR